MWQNSVLQTKSRHNKCVSKHSLDFSAELRSDRKINVFEDEENSGSFYAGCECFSTWTVCWELNNIRDSFNICEIQCTEYFSFLNGHIQFCKTVKSKQIYNRDLGRDHWVAILKIAVNVRKVRQLLWRLWTCLRVSCMQRLVRFCQDFFVFFFCGKAK